MGGLDGCAGVEGAGDGCCVDAKLERAVARKRTESARESGGLIGALVYSAYEHGISILVTLRF